MDYSPPGSSLQGILQTRILEWFACPPPSYLPDPGIKLMSLYIYLNWQAGSLQLVPPGKPSTTSHRLSQIAEGNYSYKTEVLTFLMFYDLELLSNPICCFYFLDTSPSHKYYLKMITCSIKIRKRKTSSWQACKQIHAYIFL